MKFFIQKYFKRTWLFLIGLALAGCGPAGPPGTSRTQSPSLRMGMMPKLMGIGYFNACRKGAEEAARELGIALTFDGPPVDRVELQTQMIDEWIALGYD